MNFDPTDFMNSADAINMKVMESLEIGSGEKSRDSQDRGPATLTDLTIRRI